MPRDIRNVSDAADAIRVLYEMMLESVHPRYRERVRQGKLTVEEAWLLERDDPNGVITP